MVLVVHRDRLENWFLAMTCLQGPYYCPLIGHNPVFFIGLRTEYNTLRRHLYIMGLYNNSTCGNCCTEEETSVHILCEYESLASLKHTHLRSFFLDPEDIRKLSGNLLTEQVSSKLVENMGHKEPVLRCGGARTQITVNSIEIPCRN